MISRRQFIATCLGAPVIAAAVASVTPKKKVYYAIHSVENVAPTQRIYGWMEHGFAALDNRKMLTATF